MVAEKPNGHTREFDPADTAADRRQASKLDRIKRAHAERHGHTRPTPAGADGGLSPYQRRVLEAALAITRPGEPVSPSAIAEALGTKPGRVSVAITVLRSLGQWPFARADRGPRAPRTAAEQTSPATDDLSPEPVPPRRKPARAPAPVTDQADVELLAIGRALELMQALPADAARRVMAYLSSRFQGGEYSCNP